MLSMLVKTYIYTQRLNVGHDKDVWNMGFYDGWCIFNIWRRHARYRVMIWMIDPFRVNKRC
jgi:hypothetical protein